VTLQRSNQRHRDGVNQSPRKRPHDGAVACRGRELRRMMRAFVAILRAVEELNESPQIPSTDHAFESPQADDSVVTPASREGIDEKCLPNNRSEARSVHQRSRPEGGTDQECAAIARLSLSMCRDRTCAT